MTFPRMISAAIPLAALISATAAFAEPLGRSLEGELGLSATWTGGDRVDDLYGDFSAKLTWQGVRAELGAFGVVGRKHETYVSLGYVGTSGLQVEAGAPRPAFDDFAQSGLYHVLPRKLLDRSGQSRSALTQGTLEQADFLPVGVAVTAPHGAGHYALSLHDVPGQDLRVLGAGWAEDLPGAHLDLALEVTSKGEGNAKIVYAQDLQGVTVSLGGYVMAANGAGSAVELAAGFDAAPKVHLFGFYRAEFGSAENSGGMLAEFDLAPEIALDVSAVAMGDDLTLGTMLARRF
ncbi:hypothetical protein N6L24_02960 [Cognatishimia sp. SS12]|uniref:hypothetical protein n=1 Tax=Cognatishimia sp. SS12 TaxID=2979465 RepID=UPI00232C72C4|nr:hypothetical protein [Cognatishimia sp. SS12]MDC0737229.1 hypothetical protein [Cognatishimia sp. SS12]